MKPDEKNGKIKETTKNSKKIEKIKKREKNGKNEKTEKGGKIEKDGMTEESERNHLPPSAPSGVDVKHAKAHRRREPTTIYTATSNYRQSAHPTTRHTKTDNMVEGRRVLGIRRSLRLRPARTSLETLSLAHTEISRRARESIRTVFTASRRPESSSDKQSQKSLLGVGQFRAIHRLGSWDNPLRDGRRFLRISEERDPRMGDGSSPYDRRSDRQDDRALDSMVGERHLARDRHNDSAGLGTTPARRVCLADVLPPTIGYEMASDSRLSSTKSIYTQRKVQNKYTTHDDPIDPVPGVRMESRFRGSLCAYRTQGMGSPLTAHCDRKSTFRTANTGVWDGIGTTNFYEGSSDTDEYVAPIGNKSLCLSGRSYWIREVPDEDFLGSSHSHTTLPITWFSNEMEKDDFGTATNYRYVRLDNKPEGNADLSTKGKTERFYTADSPISSTLLDDTTTCRKHSGNHSTYVDRSTFRTSSGGPTAATVQSSTLPHPVFSNNHISFSNDKGGTTGTVGFHRRMEWDATAGTDIREDHSRGQQRIWLGRKFIREDSGDAASDERPVFRRPDSNNLAAHFQESDRTSCNKSGSDPSNPHLCIGSPCPMGDTNHSRQSRVSTTERSNSPSLRQFCDGGNDQQRWFVEESGAHGRELSNASLGPEKTVNHSCTVVARTHKHDSRLRLSSSTDVTQRLDVASRPVSCHRSDVGASRNRSLFIGNNGASSSSPQVLQLGTGCGSICSERILDSVDNIQRMGQSTVDSDPRDSPEDAAGERERSDDCGPSLADTNVVSSSPGNVLRLPTANSAQSIDLPAGGPKRTEYNTFLEEDGGLESFRQATKMQGFSTAVAAAAEGGWTNTDRLQRADRGFRSWLHERNLASVEPQSYFPLALDYLLYLRTKNTPYAQLRTTKNALAGSLGECPRYGFRTLGQLRLTKQLMRAFKEGAKTTDVRYQQFWDIGIIHDYLQSCPNLEDWTLQFTTKTLAYLFKEGLVGRSSDLTRANVKTLNPSTQPEKFFWITIEGPKETAMAEERNRRRRLYRNYATKDPRLDWRAVQMHYERFPTILRYRARNLERNSHTKALLLTFGGQKPGLSPSEDTVTRWVAEIMWRAGIPDHFMVHSVRGAVATSKLRNDLENELQGIWKSISTRRRYYDRSQEAFFTREEAARLRDTRKTQVWKFRAKAKKDEHLEELPVDSADEGCSEDEDE